MLPALLVYCCVVVLPALYTAFLSLFKWNGLGEKKFVLFRNYVNLFTTDAVFKTALKNNIIWIILTLLFTMTIALLLAMLLNRKFKGRVVYRAIFYFPYMLSWIVIGIIWKWIYNPNIGFLDSLLNLLGIQTSGAGWLSDPKIALYCVFAAALWQGVGQPMLYFLAGLRVSRRNCMRQLPSTVPARLRRSSTSRSRSSRKRLSSCLQRLSLPR